MAGADHDKIQALIASGLSDDEVARKTASDPRDVFLIRQAMYNAVATSMNPTSGIDLFGDYVVKQAVTRRRAMAIHDDSAMFGADGSSDPKVALSALKLVHEIDTNVVKTAISLGIVDETKIAAVNLASGTVDDVLAEIEVARAETARLKSALGSKKFHELDDPAPESDRVPPATSPVREEKTLVLIDGG